MAEQTYKVRDPAGEIREIKGPEGASEEEVIAQAKKLFAPKGDTSGFGDSVKRQAGLAARAFGPTGAGAALGAGVGSVVPGVGTVAGGAAGAAAGGLTQLLDNVLGLGMTERAMDALGLPKPESTAEKFAQDVAAPMASGAGFIGLGQTAAKMSPTVVSKVLERFAERPGLQTAAAAAGGASGAVAREAGADPLTQTGASMAGAMMTPAGAAGFPAFIRRAFRGPESNIAAGVARTKQFAEAGTTPSVAQAYQTHTAQALEGYLPRSVGAHGVMRDFAMKQAKEVGERVDDVAGILSGKTSPMVAGRAVEEGITGKDGFLDVFKATQKRLYGKLDTYIPAATPVKVDNAMATLDRLSTPTVGAEQTGALFVNPKIAQIRDALIEDTKAFGAQSLQGLPYGALKDLRSKVGAMLADSALIADMPRAQLKQLYAGLSADMEAAVKATGNKDAQRVFDRANAYTRAGHQRIDEVLQPIIDKNAPEKIFSALFTSGKEGDTIIHGVMQSLPEPSQKALAATIVRKLGRALPSKQTAEGDLFSTETFLSNWNKISPEAKRSIFSRFGKDYVESLDRIAQTASDIRVGGQVYANPSGTAPVLTLHQTLFGTAILLLTGHPILAGTVIGEEAAARAMASRLMTNPSFVNWLGKTSQGPKGLTSAALNQLAQNARREKDDDMAMFATAMKQANPQQNTVVAPRASRPLSTMLESAQP